MKVKIAKKIIFIILLLAGIGIALMPAVFNEIDEKQTDSKIEIYQVEMQKNTSAVSDEIKAARKYNKELFRSKSSIIDTGFNESENYEQLLDFGDQMMGYIDIPAIEVKVPVFHDDDECLSRGAIHVKGTSLPIGGKSTHSVIAAHTGNSNGKFFTDLVNLKEGDKFALEVGSKSLCYEIDQIKVVLPSDRKDLEIVEGKDYCTLLTCTPYGVNSHRLLVRGKRIFPDKEELELPELTTIEEKRSSKWNEEYISALAIAFSIFIVVMTLLDFICKIMRKRKSHD